MMFQALMERNSLSYRQQMLLVERIISWLSHTWSLVDYLYWLLSSSLSKTKFLLPKIFLNLIKIFCLYVVYLIVFINSHNTVFTPRHRHRHCQQQFLIINFPFQKIEIIIFFKIKTHNRKIKKKRHII